MAACESSSKAVVKRARLLTRPGPRSRPLSQVHGRGIRVIRLGDPRLAVRPGPCLAGHQGQLGAMFSSRCLTDEASAVEIEPPFFTSYGELFSVPAWPSRCFAPSARFAR